jgi:glycosyltransferase involved in cell wall biosynthesis
VLNSPDLYTLPGVSEASPIVSVVIPTKNRVQFLQSTIDSVLSQDYPNIECIVADGGSTDGTIELLESYGDKIEWELRQHSGMA